MNDHAINEAYQAAIAPKQEEKIDEAVLSIDSDDDVLEVAGEVLGVLSGNLKKKTKSMQRSLVQKIRKELRELGHDEDEVFMAIDDFMHEEPKDTASEFKDVLFGE